MEMIERKLDLGQVMRFDDLGLHKVVGIRYGSHEVGTSWIAGPPIHHWQTFEDGQKIVFSTIAVDHP